MSWSLTSPVAEVVAASPPPIEWTLRVIAPVEASSTVHAGLSSSALKWSTFVPAGCQVPDTSRSAVIARRRSCGSSAQDCLLSPELSDLARSVA